MGNFRNPRGVPTLPPRHRRGTQGDRRDPEVEGHQPIRRTNEQPELSPPRKLGFEFEKVVNVDSMSNPDSLSFFKKLAIDLNEEKIF